jgi:N-acetylneuraminic acid mutarotase
MTRPINHLLAYGVLALTACGESTAPNPQKAPASDPQVTALSVSAAAANTWTTKRITLFPPRFDMVAATVNNFIYLIGGDAGHEPDRELGTHDAYDVVKNVWIRRKTLPSGRSELNGASVIGGKIYVTGGLTSAPDASGFLISKALLVYNPQTNTWGRRADMPRRSANGAQGVINGLLYVYVPSGGNGEFFRYNPTTNSWTRRTPPPQAHGNGMAGVINGKFYLLGGEGGPSLFLTQTLNVYNPGTNSWTTKAPMADSRRAFFAGVINGKLYVTGGFGDGANVTATQVYDPVTNRWTTKAPMPTEQAAGASAVVNGRLFTIGGQDASTITRKVQVYTP